MEKTDAQKRNEDEVRRIMRERGFETTSDSESKKRRRSFNFSIIGKALVAIIIIGGLSFGVILLLTAPKNTKTTKNAPANENTTENVDLSDMERSKDSAEITAKDTSVNQSDISSAYNSIPQQTANASQPTINQNANTNYTMPDCSAEEREVKIRHTLMEREEQQYNNIFNSRKSYGELLNQVGDSSAQADILYAAQKAKIDAAWQMYKDATAAYNTAYDNLLNCERQ